MKQFKPSPWTCILACAMALCLALAPVFATQAQATTTEEADEVLSIDTDLTVTIPLEDEFYIEFTPTTTGWYLIYSEWTATCSGYGRLYAVIDGEYFSFNSTTYNMLPGQAGKTCLLIGEYSVEDDEEYSSSGTATLTISASPYSTTEAGIDTAYSGSVSGWDSYATNDFYVFTPSVTSTYTFDFGLNADDSGMGFDFALWLYDDDRNALWDYYTEDTYVYGSTSENASFSFELTAGTTYFFRLVGDYAEYTFTVTNSNPVDISSATVTLSTSSYTYNGSARKPTPTVTLDGTTLTKGTDYTVSYSSGRKNVGTYKVTVKGCGNYTGTATATFTIKAKSVSSATVKLAYSSTTYSGKAKKPSVKSVKLTLNGSTVTLTKGTDYTVSYSSNTKVGTATVKITGTGNYKGTVKKTFKITPKTVTLKSAKSSAKKKATVKWTKLSSANVTKYQIRYRVKGTSTWKTVKVSSSKSSYTLTGLKSGKTYQVQVRAYKTVSGKNYTGSWSSTKTVKVK